MPLTAADSRDWGDIGHVWAWKCCNLCRQYFGSFFQIFLFWTVRDFNSPDVSQCFVCSSGWFKPLHGKRLDRAAKMHSAFAAVDISLSATYVQQPVKTNCSEGFTKNAGESSTLLPFPTQSSIAAAVWNAYWPALVQSLRTMVWVSAFSRSDGDGPPRPLLMSKRFKCKALPQES